MKKDFLMRTGKLNRISFKDSGRKIGYFDFEEGDEIQGIMKDYYKRIKYYIIGKKEKSKIKLALIPVNSSSMEPVKVIQFYGEEFEGIKTATMFNFNQNSPSKQNEKKTVKILLESTEYDSYDEEKKSFFEILKSDDNGEVARQVKYSL